jgi:hypothetical protein
MGEKPLGLSPMLTKKPPRGRETVLDVREKERRRPLRGNRGNLHMLVSECKLFRHIYTKNSA